MRSDGTRKPFRRFIAPIVVVLAAGLWVSWGQHVRVDVRSGGTELQVIDRGWRIGDPNATTQWWTPVFASRQSAYQIGAPMFLVLVAAALPCLLLRWAHWVHTRRSSPPRLAFVGAWMGTRVAAPLLLLWSLSPRYNAVLHTPELVVRLTAADLIVAAPLQPSVWRYRHVRPPAAVFPSVGVRPIAWLPVSSLALLAAMPALVMWQWALRRIPKHLCQRCGYNLTGNVTGRCSECGAPMVSPSGAPKARA